MCAPVVLRVVVSAGKGSPFAELRTTLALQRALGPRSRETNRKHPVKLLRW